MKKTITIIEDEPFIIEALSFILEKEGFIVKSISDGAKAIEFVKDTNPDLVILDIMLPNVSGMKILEDIRSTKLIAELPVLMITAQGQKKDPRAAEDAGVNEFMTKPFDNAELIQQIKHMLKL